MKQKLERNIAMTFRVTEEERDMIRNRQKQSGIINMRAYLLKMAIDGRVISIEMESVHEMNRLLSNISNNISQIAKVANQTGRTNSDDLDSIFAQQDEIWKQQREILKKLSDVYEAAIIKPIKRRKIKTQ